MVCQLQSWPGVKRKARDGSRSWSRGGGLTQHLERMPLELGELIEEEDAMEGAIPRPADGPSP
jgi:hypothetical protein